MKKSVYFSIVPINPPFTLFSKCSTMLTCCWPTIHLTLGYRSFTLKTEILHVSWSSRALIRFSCQRTCTRDHVQLNQDHLCSKISGHLTCTWTFAHAHMNHTDGANGPKVRQCSNTFQPDEIKVTRCSFIKVTVLLHINELDVKDICCVIYRLTWSHTHTLTRRGRCNHL